MGLATSCMANRKASREIGKLLLSASCKNISTSSRHDFESSGCLCRRSEISFARVFFRLWLSLLPVYSSHFPLGRSPCTAMKGRLHQSVIIILKYIFQHFFKGYFYLITVIPIEHTLCVGTFHSQLNHFQCTSDDPTKDVAIRQFPLEIRW